MTTKTCGTCKHKGEPINDDSRDVDLADPQYGAKIQTTYFLCDLIKHISKYPDKYPPSRGAGVEDGSGYYAALCVEEDFGCVKWEQR